LQGLKLLIATKIPLEEKNKVNSQEFLIFFSNFIFGRLICFSSAKYLKEGTFEI
tara:strand:+ start:2165 stop:2326 length:162 start_codon:yes stop_codon:yes gene_type:complete